MHYLEFERPIAELEGKIVELRKLAEEDPNLDIGGEVATLQSRAGALVNSRRAAARAVGSVRAPKATYICR